jgi:hypothetical protein
MKRFIYFAYIFSITVLFISGCVARSETQTDKNMTSDCLEQIPSQAQLAANGAALITSDETARPGQRITLSLRYDQPMSISRGIDSYLECWNGNEWVTKFLMVSASGSETPAVQPYPLPPDVTIPGVGITGLGPESVNLPTRLSPGWYRIRKQVSILDGDILRKVDLYCLIKVED